MKSVLIAACFIAASTTASAATVGSVSTTSNTSTQFLSGKASSVAFEAGNRKGSKRVGGTGRSGKGSHYVGSRK